MAFRIELYHLFEGCLGFTKIAFGQTLDATTIGLPRQMRLVWMCRC